MAGRKQVAEPREVVIAVRVKQRDADFIDAQRGSLSRSAWLRLLLLRERKGNTP